MPAGQTAELAEEVERHVALHAAPQLLAGEPAPEARLAGRLDPFLHVLDHVHRHRPPEPRHQRPRKRIVVRDGPYRSQARPSLSRSMRR